MSLLSRTFHHQAKRLINFRELIPGNFKYLKRHIISDIDKTYLETDFESISKMARIAFEDAQDKLTVEGATAFFETLRYLPLNESNLQTHHTKCGLHFISSSPPQLRNVLEEKFLIDQLIWDSDTFKNQIYNIRKGRLDLLKFHIPYKMYAILHLLTKLADKSEFILIGDNAETDPLIYWMIFLMTHGSFNKGQIKDLIEKIKIEKEHSEEILQIWETLQNQKKILYCRGIFIRQLPGKDHIYSKSHFAKLIPFEHYYQLSVYLAAMNWISSEEFSLLKNYYIHEGMVSERGVKEMSFQENTIKSHYDMDRGKIDFYFQKQFQFNFDIEKNSL